MLMAVWPAIFSCTWREKGVSSLRAADGASVLGFLESLRGRWAENSMGSAVISCRPFLAFTQRIDLVNALKMVGPKQHHGIVPVLGSEGEQAVVRACTGGKVSAWDAAITLLELVTGLRACDLIAVRLNHIDWADPDDRDRAAEDWPSAHASAVSCHRGEACGVCSRGAAGFRGWARLLANGGAPHAAGRSCHHLCGDQKSFQGGWGGSTAGRDQVVAPQCRNQAPACRTPLPTISAVLGHSSPDSTNVYLSADAEHMRACVLPLPPPVPQGAIR